MSPINERIQECLEILNEDWSIIFRTCINVLFKGPSLFPVEFSVRKNIMWVSPRVTMLCKGGGDSWEMTRFENDLWVDANIERTWMSRWISRVCIWQTMYTWWEGLPFSEVLGCHNEAIGRQNKLSLRLGIHTKGCVRLSYEQNDVKVCVMVKRYAPSFMERERSR